MRSRMWSIGALLLILGLLPTLVGAQSPAFETRHEYAFGQSADFYLTVPEETSIENLRFLLDFGEGPEVHARPLEDDEAHYHRNLQARPFPPYANITYWWEYRDEAGTRQTTAETTFRYVDHRFDWRSYQHRNVHLHWVTDSERLHNQALEITQTFLEDAEILFEEPLPKPIYVYIYPSTPDLNQALRLAGATWVGGEAYPQYDVALLGLKANQEASLKLKQLLPHELTHLALAQNLGARAYAELPAWVKEGLATSFEQRADAAYEIALDDAERKSGYLPPETLCQPFVGLSQDQRILAYAESQSLMRYVQQTYGWTNVHKLLTSYADGLGCSQGVEQSLNRSMTMLEREWRAWRAQDEQPAPPSRQVQMLGLILLGDVAPWLLLTLLLLLPGVLSLLTRRTP